MALPVYTTDLTTLFDFDTIIPVVGEPSGYTAGRSPIEDDADNPIQGTLHGSLTMNTIGLAGIMGNVGAFTWSAGHYMFGWIIWTAPSTIGTRTNGGLVMCAGNSNSSYRAYYVGGVDYGSYPYGGWQNFVVDPTVAGDNDVGTPTEFNYAGCGANVLAQVSKGNPLAMDAFSYGRGEFRVAGGELGSYANFSDMALENDISTNRWGLFQSIEGSFKFKGHMILGYLSPIEFEDANKSIVVDVTMYVNQDFNTIEVRNASSIVKWANISITQLGVNTISGYDTASRCSFIATDNPIINKTVCTFTDMGTFEYGSNSALTSTTHRRCEAISQLGGTFTDGVIDVPSGLVGMTVTNLDLITAYVFNSKGTGYAIDLGIIATTQALSWNNTESGYVVGTTGTNVGLTPTGNETIYVDVTSGEVLTINVGTGASIPSVANSGTGTVNVVAGLLPLTLHVVDAVTKLDVNVANIMIQREDTKAEIISGATNTSGVYSESVAASYDGVAYVGWVRQSDLNGIDYIQKNISGSIGSTGFSITVELEHQL